MAAGNRCTRYRGTHGMDAERLEARRGQALVLPCQDRLACAFARKDTTVMDRRLKPTLRAQEVAEKLASDKIACPTSQTGDRRLNPTLRAQARATSGRATRGKSRIGAASGTSAFSGLTGPCAGEYKTFD